MSDDEKENKKARVIKDEPVIFVPDTDDEDDDIPSTACDTKIIDRETSRVSMMELSRERNSKFLHCQLLDREVAHWGGFLFTTQQKGYLLQRMALHLQSHHISAFEMDMVFKRLKCLMDENKPVQAFNFIYDTKLKYDMTRLADWQM